eukprot:3136795-Prymnesium_polylepis.1
MATRHQPTMATRRQTRAMARSDAEANSVRATPENRDGSAASAGVIPYTPEGFWLGRMAEGWSDFGGKRERTDSDAWCTARRELEQESGLCVSQHEQR